MKIDKSFFEQVLYWLYLLAWATIGAMITVSKAVTSIAEIVLAATFIIQAFVLRKANWRGAIVHPHFWSLVLIYLLFCFGLIYSTDFSYGFHDLRIKLPILILPLFYFAGQQIEHWQKLVIFAFFITGALIASLIGYFINIDELAQPGFSSRELSPFVSHIRLSQALSISLLLIYYFVTNLNHWSKWFLILPGIWILYFLNVVESLTALMGMVIVGVSIVFLNFYLISKWLSRVLFILLILISGIALVRVYGIGKLVFKDKQAYATIASDTLTINGNLYSHDVDNKNTENGYLLGAYLQKDEMQKAWNNVANLKYSEKVNGFPIQEVIIRFLTSKGLRKDSVGVYDLSAEEISAIENGVSNVYYLNHSGLEERIHRTFWEINIWRKSGHASGSSLILRSIYWKKAWRLFTNNWLIGVGTGDVQQAFDEEYSKNNEGLAEEFHKKAHNEYLTVFLTLGVIGGTIFLVCCVRLFLLSWKNAKFIGIGALSIIYLGLLYEDGIETQAGVTLFTWVILLIGDFHHSLRKHKANSESFD